MVVWTYDSDKQTWLSISVMNTFGPIWITLPRLATLDPWPMGEKARMPTAKTRNIAKTGNLFFIPHKLRRNVLPPGPFPWALRPRC